MKIADRLYIPDSTQAILWDMDGVLLDTLGLDLTICNQLLNKYVGKHVNVSKSFIRSIFAYHPLKFWQLIVKFIENEYKVSVKKEDFDKIFDVYNKERCNFVFQVNPGIHDILKFTKKKLLKSAVVSNNPTEDIEKILSQSGLFDYFDHVIGNDIHKLKKKPAPDTYIFAAEQLGVKPEECVVIEDSLLGTEAGYMAKCFTIGVATGGDDFVSLEQVQWTDQVYTSFLQNKMDLRFGQVTNKKISTPNEFVSHMIEHIAWRLGFEIYFYWNNNNWFQMGKEFGSKIKEFGNQEEVGVAFGMIDDGSAEVLIEMSDEPNLVIESIERLDLDWFINLRCEQISSGKPLIQLIRGLAQGLNAKILLKVCSVEDPHHSWEGIFRSIGIAMQQMFSSKKITTQEFRNMQKELPTKNVSKGKINVNAVSCTFAEVSRTTAESYALVTVDFSRKKPNWFMLETSPSINIKKLENLLENFTEQAGFTLQIKYDAKRLSSSHVIWEDIALLLGRALKEIFVLRMEHFGANGAGSSLCSKDDFYNQPIRVGVSVEGRKFFKFVPFQDSFDVIRKHFIIGQKVLDSLLSEDLDDFLDGLAGGLDCSIIIHLKELKDANEGWQLLFKNLGKAMKQVFDLNPYRKGVPPGVKATLS